MPEAPLSITGMNTSGARTALPIIQDKAKVKLVLIGIKQDKNDKGDIIVFECKLADNAPSIEGGVINAGFPVFDRVYLYDKDTPAGQIPERSLAKISRYIDATLGTGDVGNKKNKPQRPDFGPDVAQAMFGKEFIATFKVKTGEYEGNEITKVEHLDDLKA